MISHELPLRVSLSEGLVYQKRKQNQREKTIN